jgi:hypothetical protein
MTTYKTVVSWLAFLLLVWYEVYFGLELGRHLYGRFVVGSYQRITFGDVAFAIFLAVAAVLMMLPWGRYFLIWRGRSPSEMPLTETLAEQLNTVGRWLLIPLFVYWTFKGVFGVAILIALLSAPELSILVSSGFTGFIDAVFFPGGREKIPPYTLKLARFYREDQRLAEAEAEYARMLSFYPEQLEAWQERLDLAFQRKETADPAPREVLAEAIHALPQPRDKEVIFQRFSRLSQGILDQ